MIFFLPYIFLLLISGQKSYEGEDIFPPNLARSQPNLTSVEGFGPPGPLEGATAGRPMEKKQRGQTSVKSGEFLSTLQPGAGIGGPFELHVSLHGGAGSGPSRSFPEYGGNRYQPAQPPVPNNSIGYPGQYRPNGLPIGYPGQYRPNGLPNGYPGLYNLGQNPTRLGPVGFRTSGYPQTIGK